MNPGDKIAGLSSAKQALLELRLKQKAPATLSPRPDPTSFPLSFSQERLWFFDQLEPASPVYHRPAHLRLTGRLDAGALQRSLNEIVRRHETLRATFQARDGRPVQTVIPMLRLPLDVIDLSQAAEVEFERLSREEAVTPFDLSRGPLIRARLVSFSPENHVLLLTVHHIVFDAWSHRLLMRELAALYEAFRDGRPSPFPDLPLQYADYAHHQREQSRTNAPQRAYWKQQLAGAPHALDLPSDFSRSRIQTFRGAEETLVLDQALVTGLKALGRQEEATLFMTLLTAFKILLLRQTAQHDLVVGAPIAGRNLCPTDSLIGCFVNMLVLRTNLAGNPSFGEALRRVRAVTLSALANQDLPFEKLVEELQPQRDLGTTPLFQVFFNMVTQTVSRMALPGLTMEPMALPAAGAKFDLTLDVREYHDRVQARLIYNADRFARARMVEWLGQYELLLRQVTARPEGPIGELSLLTPAARKLLPDPAQPLCSAWEGSIIARFREQARRAPASPAVLEGSAAWTYGELEAYSNRLANGLHASGIRPGQVVAIDAHRCAALVGALLGVLKAGAAFLILDRAHPPLRRQELVRLAKPRCWVQLGAEPHPLPTALSDALDAVGCGCRLAFPSTAAREAPTFQDCADAPPAVELGPDDLAYVAFTSGTTGTPKGILGTHRPLSHFFKWQTETFGLNNADSFSMLSGLSHDPLLRDILTPLWLGAKICIPDTATIQSPAALVQWMAQQQITVVHLTPAFGQWLTESRLPETPCQLPSLRYAFFGGDRLTRHDIRRWKELAPAARCVNFYGATETPQAMGCFVVPDESSQGDPGTEGTARAKETVPLGRGIADVQLLVLTEAQQLAGIGEVGEIHVRTPYLSQGYLDDPSLTQRSFVANPFTGVKSDRLYRTGDFGHYLSDGNVEWIGRRDQQVKLRGYRIELGESEAALNQHPAVLQSAVLCREDTPDRKCLVAYVVPKPGRGLSASELRAHLAERLPSYLIPSVFVPLDAFPLTPHGKLDRTVLPAPEQLQSAAPETRTERPDFLERQLLRIWRSVLGRENIGRGDNFFELGGHSLLAVRLFAEVERVLGRKLPLATLFLAPTIERLAGALRQDGWKEPWSCLVPIQPAGSRPPFFCVHGLGGNVLNLADLAQRLGPDQPFYGLQALGLDNCQRPLARCEEMAARYLAEVRALQPEGPYFLGGLSFGGLVAWEMAAQLKAQGQEVGLLALLDTYCLGFLRLLPKPLFYRYKAQSHLARLWHNLRQFCSSPEKARYLRGKWLGARRKILSHFWQTCYRKRAQGGGPLPRALFDVRESNYLASLTYRPAPLSARVALFRARDRAVGYDRDTAFCWTRLTHGAVEIYDVPGDHTTLVLEPNAPVLAERLRACLGVDAHRSEPV